METFINDEDKKKLKVSIETIWEAMDKLIELDGYSDLTLHLEGTYYEIRDMIEDGEK